MKAQAGDTIRIVKEKRFNDVGTEDFLIGNEYEVLKVERDGRLMIRDNKNALRNIDDHTQYEVIGKQERKAQVGDLIRIVNSKFTGGHYKNGDILEVVKSYKTGVDISLFDTNGENVHVWHREYVIHRKAGEEFVDEEDIDELSTQEPEGKYRIVKGAIVTDETEQAVRIRKAGEELTDLLVRKNHDYGDSFSQQYGKYGLMSALIRMDDKMRRLETLLESEDNAKVDESLSDTLLDLAGYALLAYVEQRKH